MTTTNLDLTLDICTEDGSRARFYQKDPDCINKTLRQLVTPRLFNPPLLTLASEHSISAIPTRTIDMILAHTASPPPLPLPSGWVDVVEVNDEALVDLADLEASAAAENKHVMLAEIHTLGDWMIRLKLETIVPDDRSGKAPSLEPFAGPARHSISFEGGRNWRHQPREYRSRDRVSTN